MSHFDRPEPEARRAALTAERDAALWEALLDAPSAAALYRIFESTVAANGWDAALMPIHSRWKALGYTIMSHLDQVDVDALPASEREYAGHFFRAAHDCWTATSLPNTSERVALRRDLERAQALRVAQLATEPLPLGLPPQSLAVRLPTVPLEGRDAREYTVLLLRPLTPPAGAAPVYQLDFSLSPEGLYVHVQPCTHDGEPLQRTGPTRFAPGCTLISATWSDLGLGEHGPYYNVRDVGTQAIEPRLGISTELRFVSGAQRAALLLCTQHDIVRIEMADAGHELTVALECPGRASRLAQSISYCDRALLPQAPHGPCPL